MALLQAVSFPGAPWNAISVGGVIAMCSGLERPRKYEPESQTIKHFGLLNPDAELEVQGTGEVSPSSLTGVYIYTFVEVDSKANQGQGRWSGPPKDSEGASATVADGSVTLTLPLDAMNPETDQLWIYRTLAGGTWDTLGRIAVVPFGQETYIDAGDTPDFVNFPLDANVDAPPNKAFPAKMNRRLLLWGSEPLESTLLFAEGSTQVDYVSGDPLDDGCIRMVIYPTGEDRGYLITDFVAGSPGVLTIQDAFEGNLGSPDVGAIDCKICRPAGELAWSEPDNYENFPAANVRYVELSAADPESGIGVINSRGLLFTLAKTFVLSFDTLPNQGWGSIFELSTTTGCSSHRTIKDCDGVLLWLSEGGIAASRAGPPRIISDDIWPEFEDIIRDTDGRVSRAFAVNWAAQRKYICFVPTADDSVGCSRAIVVDYKRIPGEPPYRFSIYTFDKEFTSGTLERHAVTGTGATNYYDYPVFGDKDGYVWSFGIGDADGPDSGTVSGTVASASSSPATLTDTSAVFATTGLGLNGMPVTIRRASDGEEQVRIVSTTQSDTLSFVEEFAWLPVPGDTYWVGGIDWFYETGWSAFGAQDRIKKVDRLETTFEVQSGGAITPLVYQDFSTEALSLSEEGESLDMSEASGRVSRKISGRRGFWHKLRWEGHLPDEPAKIRAASVNVVYGEP